MLIDAVSIVAVVFLMIGVGFLFEQKGWLGTGAAAIMSRLTLRIGLPGLIFSSILTNYTRALLREGALSLLIPLGVMGLMYSVSAPLCRTARIGEKRRGVFRALFTFGNTLFVGLPICRALFGEEGVPSVLLYYLVNTSFWWLIGAPGVARDGGRMGGSPIKRLASPPLLSCMAGIFLVLLDLRPPAFLMTAIGYLGAMVTPLSLLFIGATLCAMLKKGLRWQRGYGWILLSRTLLGPCLCLPIALFMGLPPITLGVFFIQSGMPSQTQTCLWAQEMGADAEYAAGAVTLTTLVSLITIPLYALILGWVG